MFEEYVAADTEYHQFRQRWEKEFRIRQQRADRTRAHEGIVLRRPQPMKVVPAVWARPITAPADCR